MDKNLHPQATTCGVFFSMHTFLPRSTDVKTQRRFRKIPSTIVVVATLHTEAVRPTSSQLVPYYTLQSRNCSCARIPCGPYKRQPLLVSANIRSARLSSSRSTPLSTAVQINCGLTASNWLHSWSDAPLLLLSNHHVGPTPRTCHMPQRTLRCVHSMGGGGSLRWLYIYAQCLRTADAKSRMFCVAPPKKTIDLACFSAHNPTGPPKKSATRGEDMISLYLSP